MANWRNTISIKDQFEETTTPELVVKLCESLQRQLKSLKEKEEKGNLQESDKYVIDDRLEEVIDNFRFLKDLADGTISQSSWPEYEFDGNYESMFNNYLSELYDLADIQVETVRGISQKFCWIK